MRKTGTQAFSDQMQKTEGWALASENLEAVIPRRDCKIKAASGSVSHSVRCMANQQLWVLIVQRGLPSSVGSQAARGKALGRSSWVRQCDITATGAWGSVNVPGDSDGLTLQYLHQDSRPSKMAG